MTAVRDDMLEQRSAAAADLSSPDVFSAFARMKALLETHRFNDQQDCALWIRALAMQAPQHHSLGYNFQLVRRWLGDTQSDMDSAASSDEEDEHASNVSEWTFHALLDMHHAFLSLCDSVCRHVALYHESCVYEMTRLAHAFLAHHASSSVHSMLPTAAWALAWAPLVHFSSTSQSTQVEILSMLVTITDDPCTHDKSAHADVILAVLTSSCPALLSTAPPPNAGLSVGASCFTGRDLSLPLTHQWLRLLFHAMLRLPSLQSSEWPFQHCNPLTFRRYSMMILAEEDDVMVDVLHHALQLPLTHAAPPRSMLTALWNERSPALWFADFCGVLNDDASVLIDLVTSEETNALAYVVAFFRHVCSHWPTCRAAWAAVGRLDDVVTMLTRCRVELSRLDRHGDAVLGFNVGPLVRRLVAMERLFDGDDGGDERGDDDAHDPGDDARDDEIAGLMC